MPKTKTQKRQEAEQRQAAWSALTVEQKIAKKISDGFLDEARAIKGQS